MENKLENIFVPYEIAELAYKKGFREWCAGVKNIAIESIVANTFEHRKGVELECKFDYLYFADNSFEEYGLPTHFQLMAWLQTNHNIHLSFDKSRKLSVFIPEKSSFKFITENGESEFEINKALEIALNTLPNVS